jgi:ABC-type lipoprotein export system ATPase subunit
MVGKPDLLLADEPTGALDTKSGNQIMEIFRKLSEEGMTIIMITHEPSIAACADRCVTILDGVLSEGLMTEAAGRPEAEESAKAMQTEADAAAKTEDTAEEIKETKQSAEKNE